MVRGDIWAIMLSVSDDVQEIYEKIDKEAPGYGVDSFESSLLIWVKS
jgi:hypothetical protein